ncbi:hypothetical protein HDU99_002924, partial [Rhizoclosmatium hyalinum]
MQTTVIRKLVSPHFSKDFPEAQAFITSYSLDDSQIGAILKSVSDGSLTEAQAACAWVQGNRPLWEPWIPTLPQSVGNDQNQ